VKAPSTLFRTGIWLKGINGALELLAGLLLAVVPEGTLARSVLAVVGFLAGEDIRDWALRNVASELSRLQAEWRFALFYLLSHGAVKVLLAVGLLRGVRGAAPVALVVFGLLAAYEIVRFALHPSVPMALIIVIDLAVLALIASHLRKQGA